MNRKLDSRQEFAIVTLISWAQVSIDTNVASARNAVVLSEAIGDLKGLVGLE